MVVSRIAKARGKKTIEPMSQKGKVTRAGISRRIQARGR